MGYTHYWTNKAKLPPLSDAATAKLERLFKENRPLICYAEDDSRPAALERELIRFNGMARAYETFIWTTEEDFNFCKTAREPYDKVVCLTLLVLKEEYKDKMQLSSDGDEEEWEPIFKIYSRMYGVLPDMDWLSRE